MPTTALHHQRDQRRLHRSRTKLAVNQTLPRLCVNRSLRHISVQLIDDNKGVTLAQASDLLLTGLTKTQEAVEVGKDIAAKALITGVTAVRFDRGASKYHGRVAALAEAARQAGLQF